MDYVIDLFSGVLIMLGLFFTFTGSLGLVRMPDFYTRLHPCGITDSLGAPLVLVGLMVDSGFSLYSAKAFLLIILLFITAPTATHAISQSAIMSGLKPLGKSEG